MLSGRPSVCHGCFGKIKPEDTILTTALEQGDEHHWDACKSCSTDEKKRTELRIGPSSRIYEMSEEWCDEFSAQQSPAAALVAEPNYMAATKSSRRKTKQPERAAKSRVKSVVPLLHPYPNFLAPTISSRNKKKEF